MDGLVGKALMGVVEEFVIEGVCGGEVGKGFEGVVVEGLW